MRNGNSKRSIIVLTKTCSYRTYEEWKPGHTHKPAVNWSSFLPYLWGMETFYNSIFRPLVLGTFLPYLWGMETSNSGKTSFIASSSYRTYEEWKHMITGSLEEHPFSFLPYLWGMETQLRSKTPIRGRRFLPYLWGMETSAKNSNKSMECICSYRTYEEWKHAL